MILRVLSPVKITWRRREGKVQTAAAFISTSYVHMDMMLIYTHWLHGL